MNATTITYKIKKLAKDRDWEISDKAKDTWCLCNGRDKIYIGRLAIGKYKKKYRKLYNKLNIQTMNYGGLHLHTTDKLLLECIVKSLPNSSKCTIVLYSTDNVFTSERENYSPLVYTPDILEGLKLR